MDERKDVHEKVGGRMWMREGGWKDVDERKDVHEKVGGRMWMSGWVERCV